MSKKFEKKPLAIAIGTVMAGSLSATSAANADANPFGMSDLSSGYMQLSEAEMKCGEGKCGGQMKGSMEGKCAGAKKTAEGEKKADGQCGAMMKESKEGKCGGAKTEEAKCGAMMDQPKDQPKAAEEKK